MENLAELCQTDLERQIFEHLIELGYRATPHVSVSDHSIDIVVEGADDRRLAIELDGDRDDTADAWLTDWSRQKVLERVGWRFWRCWASSFTLDPEACLKDLVETLAEMEIEPIGQATPQQVHSEQRVIEEESAEEDHEEEDLAMAMLVVGTDEDTVIDVGDRILVSYSDDPSRYRTLVISENDHDPENGIFSASDSVARAMLGAAAGEEIEVVLDGDINRIVTIFQIEKPGAQVSLTGS